MENDDCSGSTKNQVFIAYPACPKDEINLIGIWQVLWEGKKILFGLIFASTIIAAVIAFFLPKVYRVTTVLRAPDAGGVVELSVPGIYKADPLKIYKVFLRNLHSKGLRYKYFKKKQLIRHIADGRGKKIDEFKIFQDTFDRKIGILSGRNGRNNGIDFTTVTLDGTDSKHLAVWLNEYITFIDHFTARSLSNEVRVLLKAKAKDIRKKIETLRMVTSREYEDRIVQLKEALAIAKRLKMKKPMGSVFVSNDSRVRSTGKEAGSIFNSQNAPIYFLGFEVLQLELEQLRKRKDNDSFMSGLRDLQGELAILENKFIDFNQVHTLKIDQEVREDSTPVKPRPVLIIVLGFAFGLLVGIFGVLARRVFAVEESIT